VLERVFDGQIAVDGDRDQVEDRGAARQNYRNDGEKADNDKHSKRIDRIFLVVHEEKCKVIRHRETHLQIKTFQNKQICIKTYFSPLFDKLI